MKGKGNAKENEDSYLFFVVPGFDGDLVDLKRDQVFRCSLSAIFGCYRLACLRLNLKP